MGTASAKAATANATSTTSSRTATKRTSTGTTRRADYTVRYLWLFCLGALVPYAVGLATFVRANAMGIETFVGAVASGVAVERLAVDRFGVATLESAVLIDAPSGDPAAVALVAGALLLPATFTYAVRTLRSRTVWKATWFYPVAALGPLVGLSLHVLGVASLPLDVFLFGLAPFVSVVAFLLHRFVL